MGILKSLKQLIFLSKNQRIIASNVEDMIDYHNDFLWNNVKSYKEIPGPKPIPLLGNTWRFIPLIGKKIEKFFKKLLIMGFLGDIQIEHIDQVSQKLYKKYGKIVKMGGLLGRPDMLFLFDPEEIAKVFRQEDVLPHRPSMPSLNYYKHVYRKEFFGDNCGVIAV